MALRLSFIFLMFFTPVGMAELSFPEVNETNKVDKILETYPIYLQFVQAIGKSVEPETTKNLMEGFDKLEKADRIAAARFLKSLRYEMDQKLEFLGASPRKMTTQSPVMRQWVAKFLPNWEREVNDLIFKSVAMEKKAE